MKKDKLISIVIPTYKNRGGLDRAINSVLNQDYNNIEIIVVDDNPPKSEYRESTESLMSLYSNVSKVYYIRHERNKNGAAARNTGIKASKGEFIAFLDDDDFFLHGKLTKQAHFLENHQEFDAVYCLAHRNKYSCPQRAIEGDGTRDILLLSSNFYTPTLMFRRKALESISGFDESFQRHQDFELLLRFFSAGYKIGCVPEVLVEIGLNGGENILVGRKVEELKAYFFSKFDSYIDKEDQKTPGFSDKVYAIHYAGVFLSHLKTKNLYRAIMVFGKYFFKSPKAFNNVLIEHIRLHLK